MWSLGREQWFGSEVRGKPGVGGAFGSRSFAPATICGCVSTTVLGEGCVCISLMVGECRVLGWSRPGVLCVPRVGSVRHKWIPNTPRHNTPSVCVPLVERGFVFELLALD